MILDFELLIMTKLFLFGERNGSKFRIDDSTDKLSHPCIVLRLELLVFAYNFTPH